MTFRVRRLVGTPRVTLALSGELNGDQLAELGVIIEREKPDHVVLDLADVTLATREGIALIRRAVTEGAGLVNCPRYIRRWVDSGRDEA